jgi:hypothetical protein
MGGFESTERHDMSRLNNNMRVSPRAGNAQGSGWGGRWLISDCRTPTFFDDAAELDHSPD